MITQYHRPLTLDEAIALTARPDVVIIAGGTSVNADPGRKPVSAVDLQALDLAGIDTDGESIRIGSTTRLQDVVDSNLVPETLRDLARREAPNTIRNAATIGGTIGAVDPESELLAGLLAFNATVTIARAGSTTEHALDELLEDPALLNGSIMTSVSFPSNGIAAADRTGRTPMDRPIVMAAAHRGHGGAVRVAMTGVSTRPVVVDPEQIDALDPPSDFRGSSGYRKSLALVLANRVFATVTGGEPT
ncbi:MAG: FAD binding domain-containing protein [Actinomycetota bacterium]|nr:FAD binding domain-containing protein [Actinomycetota bacterium]